MIQNVVSADDAGMEGDGVLAMSGERVGAVVDDGRQRMLLAFALSLCAHALLVLVPILHGAMPMRTAARLDAHLRPAVIAAEAALGTGGLDSGVAKRASPDTDMPAPASRAPMPAGGSTIPLPAVAWISDEPDRFKHGLIEAPDSLQEYFEPSQLDQLAVPTGELELDPEASDEVGGGESTLLRVYINELGTVDAVIRVSSDKGETRLERLEAAFRRLRFTPAFRAGQAVKSVKLVEVRVKAPPAGSSDSLGPGKLRR